MMSCAETVAAEDIDDALLLVQYSTVQCKREVGGARLGSKVRSYDVLYS